MQEPNLGYLKSCFFIGFRPLIFRHSLDPMNIFLNKNRKMLAHPTHAYYTLLLSTSSPAPGGVPIYAEFDGDLPAYPRPYRCGAVDINQGLKFPTLKVSWAPRRPCRVSNGGL